MRKYEAREKRLLLCLHPLVVLIPDNPAEPTPLYTHAPEGTWEAMHFLLTDRTCFNRIFIYPNCFGGCEV